MLFGRHLARAACMILAAASLAMPAMAGAPKVVVTLKPVHALVARLLEGVTEPALIVQGSASPHTFTLKPSAAQAIQNADVFIRVSPEVEPFTIKVAEALPASVALVTLVDLPGMTLLDRRTGGTFEPHRHGDGDVHAPDHTADHDDDHDEEESRSGKDGHIWLDPENAKVAVAKLSEILASKSPENAGRIKTNAGRLIADIDVLKSELAREVAPIRDKPFIAFHDAYQYFEMRFGLRSAGSITISPDVQPSAKRLIEVRQKIAALEAVCVFAEPGFQPNLVAAVTEGTAARSGTLDPEGLTLEAGPDLYFELMHRLARGLKACLEPTS